MALGAVGTEIETAGEETVATMQKVFNVLYPDVELRVTEGRELNICEAVACIGERRSAIARTGVQAVGRNFDRDPKYSTSSIRLPKVIASDAKYAVRVNGPNPHHRSIFANSTPKIRSALYTPTGYLKSKAVIATVSPFIKDHDWRIIVSQDADGNDVVDHSRLPVGLLGMAAASVERGYKLHTTGAQDLKVPEFSAAAYGTAATGFIAGVKKFKASRWKSILEACGASIAEPVEDLFSYNH
ncbi:hypothetical protein DFH09DRAFT_1085808 [Mycena vulgaris]|nr:hypothetical protein DFH09DRAFT_1085808 [Mycena vulgaris]